MNKPCAVKVHGSDINVIAKRPSARAVLRRVLPRADALVSVSRALSTELEGLGVSRSKIALVANGVNTALFTPRDKRAARRALGVSEDGPMIVFVGRLEPQKGIGELLDAVPLVRARFPRAVFVLVGEVVAKENVARASLLSPGAIVTPGVRPLKEVADWLTACDVFTLPSWMEGTPNVVLEALASGRPVVATNVGGIPGPVLPVSRRGDTSCRLAIRGRWPRLWCARSNAKSGASGREKSCARSGRSRGARARSASSMCWRGSESGPPRSPSDRRAHPEVLSRYPSL